MAKSSYDGLIAIIVSAGAAVAAVFGLFNTVLADLVPPIDDNQLSVGFVSMISLILLLVLTLLIRNRLTRVQTRTIGIVALAIMLSAIAVFFVSRDYSRTYIYRYPPQSSAEQGRYTRGELHERGRELTRSSSIADAVFRLGGPDTVNGMNLLWTEESRQKVVDRLEIYYVALALLLVAGIFTAGIAVWRAAPKSMQ